MTTTKWNRVMGGIVATAMLTTLVPAAEAGLSVRRLARVERIEASQEAAAALTAVGAASGWGRIKVEDEVRQGVEKREVEVDLFEMEPMTQFTVEADGVVLGTITTDAAGWGLLKLETDDNSHPPVPATLPAAGDLVAASVRDASDGFVLEGSFMKFENGADDSTIHEEKISLDDVGGAGAAGVAKVEREVDGTQEFDTRATGLIPGDSYSIKVDGFTAGMVTADPIGQARLKLESLDDEDPLPTDLQPVEDLRVVEWFDTGGSLILAGVFSGVSNDDDSGDDDGNVNGGNDDNGDDDNGNDDGDDDDGDDDDGDDDDDDDDDDDGDDDNSGSGAGDSGPSGDGNSGPGGGGDD